MSTVSGFRFAYALLAGTAAAALTAGAASAQTAPAAPPAAAPPVSTGEIIVTAQHRSERLRDVPISIIAKTGSQLDHARVTTLEDLNTVAPGVRIDDAGEYVQPAMRGVAATTIGPGTDSPVAIYLDGVYQPNMQTTHFEFADLDRIEVDKGPQGTLYGRNATGGAIAIFTKAPSFTPTGNFEVGYGNYNDIVAKAFVTGPIIKDVLAGSISGYFESHDDYNKNVVTGTNGMGLNSTNVRAKLLFTPTNWAQFTLTGFYINRFDRDAPDGIPLNGNTITKYDPGVIITTKPHTIAEDVQLPVHLQVEGVVLNSQFKIGDWGTLTSITSDEYSWDFGPQDDDHTYDPNGPLDAAYLNIQKDPTFTEDVNFASRKFGPVSFILGGSYFYDDDKWEPIKVGGANGTTKALLTELQPVQSYAFYGQGTWQATDRLSLTAGVRYSWEHRSTSTNEYVPNSPSTFLLLASGTEDPQTTFTSVIPRASIQYKVTDTTNVYFTYSQGFKSGGISESSLYYTPAGAAFLNSAYSTNTFAAGQTAQQGSTYKPEQITAYEVGIKSNPTPRLSFDVAAYYYDYTNLQVQIDEGFTLKLTENAATARIYGVDADVTWRATDELTLGAQIALTSAHYVNYDNASALVPYSSLVPAAGPLPAAQNDQPFIDNCLATNGVAAGNCSKTFNASGKELPRAPDLTANLTADYKKVLGVGTFDISGNLYFSDRVYFDSIQNVSQAPYATLALQASFQPAGSNFVFELWGKNVTNTTYILSEYEDSASYDTGYAPPATYGFAIKYSF